MNVSAPTVIAIDGPAGTGKSTVARRLAARLALPYLDTGAMYRALALFALEHGVNLDDRQAVTNAISHASLELRLSADGTATVLLEGEPVEPRIRAPEVATATSRIAVHPEVRARMVSLQRQLAGRHGGVIEGRDIGTKVVPETPFKFFLRAAPGVRAQRRLRDLREAGREARTLQEVEHELAERDARDESRAHSPLVPADDAIVVDTDRLDADQVVQLLLTEIRRRGGPTPSQEGATPG